MKQCLTNITGVLLATGLLLISGCSKQPKPDAPAGAGGQITISGAWALYPMLLKWSEEYRKIHPAARIDIAAGGAGKGMVDALARIVDLGMVSRKIHPIEIEKGAWWVSVVKDAVAPTMNNDNPLRDVIFKRGMTRDDLAGIWITGQTTSWHTRSADGTDADRPMHVYTRSDACGASETWAEYLGGNQQDLQGIGVYGDPGLAEAVRKDQLGIGYNNINFVYDAKTKLPVAGLTLIPIDIDANGRIDSPENFYATLDELIRAIADGRYPSPPARALHLVSGGAPSNPAVIEFLRWILTDGQRYVPEAGYINLSDEELATELRKLSGDK